MDAAAVAETLRALQRELRGRSPLYERLLAGLAGAAERGFDGGVTARLIGTPGPASRAEAAELLLAGLHHGALADPTHAHAPWFPGAVGLRARDPSEGAPGALALAYLIEHEDALADFIGSHRLQTNEIGRCAALLPGMLDAAGFGRPLRLLELGTAAGLNLRFDRYRYRYQNGPAWGPSGGPSLASRAEGAAPRTLSPPSVDVAERRGVDLDPVDPTTAEGELLLTSFVWADDTERIERLRGALRVAGSTPADVDGGDLADWAEEHAVAQPGLTTVLFHSHVRHLLSDAQVARLDDLVARGLRSAAPDAPFVYLSLERPRGATDADRTIPELTVAVSSGEGPAAWTTPCRADPYGSWVHWY